MPFHLENSIVQLRHRMDDECVEEGSSRKTFVEAATRVVVARIVARVVSQSQRSNGIKTGETHASDPISK